MCRHLKPPNAAPKTSLPKHARPRELDSLCLRFEGVAILNDEGNISIIVARLHIYLLTDVHEFILAGRVLARLAAKYHHEKIGQGRLTNDALIAMSAARFGVKVITTNERDFSRLAEFRAFQWRVAVV